MTRKTKWYQSWWFYIIIFVVLVVAVYFAARKTIAYVNYQEYLKTEIESLKKDNIKLDSLYRITAAQKDKIKIIKEKIDITEDIKKLQTLIDEYERIKKDTTPSIQNKPTPKELLDYLNKEF